MHIELLEFPQMGLISFIDGSRQTDFARVSLRSNGVGNLPKPLTAEAFVRLVDMLVFRLIKPIVDAAG